MPGSKPDQRVDRLVRDCLFPGSRHYWLDAEGREINADYTYPPQTYSFMLEEAFRWGESYFHFSEVDTLLMALPLTINQKLSGGLLVEFLSHDTESEAFLAELQKLSRKLITILENNNLLNGALMRERSSASQSERLRAEAIHSMKRGDLQKIRTIYWRLEPELFFAMAGGHRQEARRILNEVLLAIYSFSREDIGRIKGFILDLVTMMSRTMVDCGADPEVAISGYYHRLEELATIRNDESLTAWLAKMLENLIDTVELAPRERSDFRVQLALNYIREHVDEPLTRDSVAEKMGLSPAHFSRVIVAATGHGFGEHITRLRMEKAVRLLRHTNRGIMDIALECGFQDQSYFTKVFRKMIGCTPKQFRNRA
jgi:AraC-like DNA-binding protein